MEDIKKILLGIKENVSMAEHTTFKIGGKAKYFFAAKTPEQLLEAVKVAKQFKLPFFIMGGGSNLLVADKGYKGIIINFQFSNLDFQKNKIIAGAGTKLRELVSASVNHTLTGLEWAVGIPGTVGGSVYGNAGAFGSTMADIIKSVKILDIKNLKVKNISCRDCRFNNKDSIFKNPPTGGKNLVILAVVLELKLGEGNVISGELKRFADYRKKNHPLNFPSAGCIFKNYTAKITNKSLLRKYPELNEFNKGSRIPTSYLIDKAGAKGKIIGGAQVSKRHANFIINIGGARAEDVLKLIKLIKQKVKNKFNIKLEEEIQYL